MTSTSPHAWIVIKTCSLNHKTNVSTINARLTNPLQSRLLLILLAISAIKNLKDIRMKNIARNALIINQWAQLCQVSNKFPTKSNAKYGEREYNYYSGSGSKESW